MFSFTNLIVFCTYKQINTLQKCWDRGMCTTVTHHLLITHFNCLGIEVLQEDFLPSLASHKTAAQQSVASCLILLFVMGHTFSIGDRFRPLCCYMQNEAWHCLALITMDSQERCHLDGSFMSLYNPNTRLHINGSPPMPFALMHPHTMTDVCS